MSLSIDRWKSKIWMILVWISGILAYSNIFQAPFIFDDVEAIVDNPNVHSLWPVWKTLIPPAFETALAWRPFISFSFAINYAISGINPWSYHLFNLLVHLGSASLLFLILIRILNLPKLAKSFPQAKLALAGLASLLFALHPIQTEAVTYTIKRTELLMSFFYLLTLYGVLRYTDQADRNSKKWFWYSLISCLFGMGSKQGMITAPMMIFIFDRIFLAKSFREVWQTRWKLYLGLLWTSCVIVLAAILAPPVKTAGFHLNLVSPLQYAATEWRAILHYIRLAFWPNPLILDYDWLIYKHPASSALHGLGVLILIVATIAALKKNAPLGFLGVWFFLLLAPTSSLMPITTEVIAEHRMYLPMITIIILVLTTALRSWPNNQWTGYIFLVIAITFGLLTYQRNQDYRSEISIWEKTVSDNPTRSRPLTSLGTAYGKVKRHSDALKACLRASEINPYEYEAFNCAGAAYMNLDRLSEALPYFLKALEIKMDFRKAYENLVFVYGKSGDTQKAIETGEKALSITGPSKALLYNLGVAYLYAGNQKKAYEFFKQTVALDPNFLNARETLALLDMKTSLPETEEPKSG